MSVQGGPDIIKDSLIIYLDAENRDSYPGSGTTWYDISGRNYHATLTNSPTYVGKYFQFNGLNQYASIPANVLAQNSNNAGSGSFTYDLMFYLDSNHPTGSTYHHLLGRFGPLYMALIGSDSSRSFIGMMSSTSDDDPVNPNTWPTSTSITTPHSRWMMLTYQHQNDGVVRYYLNGVLLNTIGPYTNFRMQSFNETAYLGAGYSLADANSYMKGRIMFFRAYNRMLSAGEIFQNYQNSRVRVGL